MGAIRPWVGEHYEGGLLGKRVLLVGESNYDRAANPGDDHSNIICENVQACVFDGRVRFFTKVARVLLRATGAVGGPGDEIRALWQRVAFTNYVQKVFTSDRVRPGPEDWLLGREALSAQLSQHRPDVVVVMGLELASHLAWLRTATPQLSVAEIAHPSSFGFKYDTWVPRVKEAFGGQLPT